jgi:hypothetical protein
MVYYEEDVSLWDKYKYLSFLCIKKMHTFWMQSRNQTSK